MTLKTKSTNFVKQGSILAAASLISRVIGLLYRVPMSHIIGDTGDGVYQVSFEIYQIALILSSYSLPLAVSKMLSAKYVNKEYKNASRIFRASIIFSLISGGIMAAAVFFGADLIEKYMYKKYVGVAIPLRVLSPTILVVAVLGTMRGLYQSRRTMIPTAISQLIEQIGNAIISIGAAYVLYHFNRYSGNSSAWGAAGGTLGTLCGAALALGFLIFLYMIYRPVLNKQKMMDMHSVEDSYSDIYKLLAVTIIPIILSQTVYQASGAIDSALYSAFSILKSSDPNVNPVAKTYGIYGKYKLMVNIPVSIASAMSVSMIPSMVASFTQGNITAVKSNLAISVKTNMIIGFPCAIGLSVLGTGVMHMLFPSNDYTTCGKFLLCGGIAVLFFALSTVTNAALQGIDRMSLPVTHSAISLVIHVILVFVLLKFTRLDIYALIIGNVTFPLVVCALNWVSLGKALHYKQEVRNTFIIPAISSIIMGVASYCCYKVLYHIFWLLASGRHLYIINAFSVIISILFAIIVYFVFLFLLKGIDERDLKNFPMGMRLARLARRCHLMN